MYMFVKTKTNMKTKLLFAAILCAVCTTLCSAQVSVSKTSRGGLKELKQKDLDLVKSKKTLFVVDDFDLEDFREIAKEAWKVTPFELVSREEFQKDKESKYINDTYAIFEMNGHVMSKTTKSGATVDYLYVYMLYYYPSDIKQKKKKLDYDRNEIAAIYFGGNTESMWNIIRSGKFGTLTEDMYNYQIGYLKNYLQNINDHLANNESTWMYDTDYDKVKIKALAKSTLYIPEYLKVKSIWGYKDEERANPDELFKDYDYKYEFISDDALNSKILKGGTEDFYYLMYTKINGQKLVTVINGRTGEIIYKDYQTMSYSLKPKDLKALSKAIKK